MIVASERAIPYDVESADMEIGYGSHIRSSLCHFPACGCRGVNRFNNQTCLTVEAVSLILRIPRLDRTSLHQSYDLAQEVIVFDAD